MGMSNERAVPTAERLLADVYGPNPDVGHVVTPGEALTAIAENRGPIALCGTRQTWAEEVHENDGPMCPPCFDAAAALGLVDPS